MQKSSFKQFITKPPVLFPLAALFHIIITISAIVSLYGIPLTQRDWLRPLSMILFTICSVGLCSMRKWTAIIYVVLSIACLALIYFTPLDTPQHIFGDGFFPFNLILSLFILLLFKRFE